MTGHAKLDADWFSNELEEASSDLAMAFPPDAVGHIASAPLSEEDAKRLRIKMARRYRVWTHRALASDLSTDIISIG